MLVHPFIDLLYVIGRDGSPPKRCSNRYRTGPLHLIRFKAGLDPECHFAETLLVLMIASSKQTTEHRA
jgi:hypothetical protein